MVKKLDYFVIALGNQWRVSHMGTIALTRLKDLSGYQMRNGARVESVRPSRQFLLPTRELWAEAVAVLDAARSCRFKYNLVARFANASDVGEEGKRNQGWPPGFGLSYWMGLTLSEMRKSGLGWRGVGVYSGILL